MSEMKYIYVESIKKSAISARLKSGKLMHLYSGLNKVSEKDLAELKEVPLMKAYFEAKTLIEKPEIRCDAPAMGHDSPEKVEESQKKSAEMKAEKLAAKEEKMAEAKSEEPVKVEESSEELQDDEGAE